MLVLSRGQDDKVVFPTLGISVEILRIAGKRVRIGVDAPREVPVLRHEIAAQNGNGSPSFGRRPSISRELAHTLRNRLHTAALGLNVLHMRFESDEVENAEATIFKIFNELKAIEKELTPASQDASEVTTSDRPHRALLVEDDANESELFAEYLRLSGIEVDTAMDGLQAMVRLANDDRPDIVLMDMRMPRFDGPKAIKAIRKNPDYRGLKIFAVSGTQQSETTVTLGPKGVDRWFSKPVNPHDIVSAIHQELAIECVPA
ncbi:MAG: response regulator [Planctomycetota bacterium]|nr:MAG: response regulator [Planctomycetota bacterium]REK29525.1 MAG: response regulator [Planctomycetota bacterium]REK40539.1 MAG: response regulator [Planctomycetota bacterium]